MPEEKTARFRPLAERFDHDEQTLAIWDSPEEGLKRAGHHWCPFCGLRVRDHTIEGLRAHAKIINKELARVHGEGRLAHATYGAGRQVVRITPVRVTPGTPQKGPALAARPAEPPKAAQLTPIPNPPSVASGETREDFDLDRAIRYYQRLYGVDPSQSDSRVRHAKENPYRVGGSEK